MSRPTRARQDCRLDVLKKLDPVSEPKESACTSDADDSATIIDTVLAPAAQAEDFVGDWIYIRSQPTKVDSGANINEGGTFSATDVTLTVDDGTKFTVGDGIQIEDEILRVTAIATNDLTVVRAIQGTTAATHADATDVYIVGPAIGEIARITNVDFSGSTSTLTVAPAFSASPVNTQEYERHRKVRPSIINDRLDATLGLLRQNVLLPVTLVTDGDMETSGTTDWTPVTATLAKDTTYVRRGRYSLKVTGGGVGYAKSASMYLPGGTECIVEAEAYIATNSKAKLTFYDVTNSADIGTPMESDETGWVHLEGRFTVPTTCEEVQVWAYAPGVAWVTYYDHITVWPTLDKAIPLPSFLEFVYDVKQLVYIPVGVGIAGATNVNAYRINEGRPKVFTHLQEERDDTGVVSARFYREDLKPANALWLECRKPYPAFSGATDALKDVDTTQAHRNVVANLTTASILDDLALDATEAEKPQLSESLQVKAMMLRNEIAGILASMTPPKKKIITTPFTRK